MKDLTGLHVAWCDLSSEWLNEIFKCTNLIDLNVTGNKNIATHTKKLGNLNSLKILNVSYCDLTSMNLNEICKSMSLVDLNVGNNAQLWEGEVDIGDCRSRLVKLNIAKTEATEDVLRAICGLPKGERPLQNLLGLYGEGGFLNLANLNVSGNKALGRVMSQKGFSFNRLANTLTELNVSDMDIRNSSAIEAICGCEGLLKLNVFRNPHMWAGASGTFDFGRLKSQLQELNVGSTILTPDILSKIFGFDKLVDLKISHCYESCKGLGTDKVKLGGIKYTLRKIDIEQSGLTGKGLQWIFSEFKGLKEVDVSDNPEITTNDLTNLDFTTLWDRFIEIYVSTNDETVAALQKKLPLTKIHIY